MLKPDTELRYLKGVGPRRAERLREVGLETVEDLLGSRKPWLRKYPAQLQTYLYLSGEPGGSGPGSGKLSRGKVGAASSTAVGTIGGFGLGTTAKLLMAP